MKLSINIIQSRYRNIRIVADSSVTAVRALQNSLGGLLAGSESHLCAFVSQIGPLMADDECYSALYLKQHEVYDIIKAECIEFVGYICLPEDE